MTAICYEKPTRFTRYTVADGIGIPKGTILKLVSPNYATTATLDNDPAGGVAWMEKVASDGTTQISAALDGTWGNAVSTVATINVGYDLVIASSGNLKGYTTLDREKGYVIGKALQTVATTATICKFRMNI
jgi:hypothetical protein